MKLPYTMTTRFAAYIRCWEIRGPRMQSPKGVGYFYEYADNGIVLRPCSRLKRFSYFEMHTDAFLDKLVSQIAFGKCKTNYKTFVSSDTIRS
jgi:hypothetical protein